jgi:hypothetical protein
VVFCWAFPTTSCSSAVFPLETLQGEKRFAMLLTAVARASLHFSKDVTREDFVRLVRAFTVAGVSVSRDSSSFGPQFPGKDGA